MSKRCIHHLATSLILISVGGCAYDPLTIKNDAQLAAKGIGTVQDHKAVFEFQLAQDRTLMGYAYFASSIPECKNPPDGEVAVSKCFEKIKDDNDGNSGDSKILTWRQVTIAGVAQIDRSCEEYLSALYRLNQSRKSTVRNFSILGGATGAILGVAEAAAKEIAITAAVFGAGSALVDSYFSTILYELEPSSVRSIVEVSQAKLIDEFNNKNVTPLQASTKLSSTAFLAKYTSTCLPNAIETEVNKALKSQADDYRKSEFQTDFDKIKMAFANRFLKTIPEADKPLFKAWMGIEDPQPQAAPKDPQPPAAPKSPTERSPAVGTREPFSLKRLLVQ